jgi:hypothetical protein
METERLTAEHRAQLGVNHVILELMRVAKQIANFRGIDRPVQDDKRGLGRGVVRGDPQSAPIPSHSSTTREEKSVTELGLIHSKGNT